MYKYKYSFDADVLLLCFVFGDVVGFFVFSLHPSPAAVAGGKAEAAFLRRV